MEALTGGLTHSMGEPTKGWIDEEFDQACIQHFTDGEDARAAFLTRTLRRTGRGPSVGGRPRRGGQQTLRVDRLSPGPQTLAAPASRDGGRPHEVVKSSSAAQSFGC